MPPTAATHDHAISIDLALEFLDTLEYQKGQPVELLPTTSDAIDWLEEHGLIHDPCEPELDAAREPGPAADRALGRIRAVRAALREIVDATVEDRPPSLVAIDTANAAMDARQRMVLVARATEPDPNEPAGTPCIVLDHRHVGDPLDDVLARLTERIARAASGAEAERLRICDNDECRMPFYDGSRTGKRRWCDMATCGNRAKAARHRARVRAGESEAASA
jgi:predicted RNA-binding Zn ribbon-like protein